MGSQVPRDPLHDLAPVAARGLHDEGDRPARAFASSAARRGQVFRGGGLIRVPPPGVVACRPGISPDAKTTSEDSASRRRAPPHLESTRSVLRVGGAARLGEAPHEAEGGSANGRPGGLESPHRPTIFLRRRKAVEQLLELARGARHAPYGGPCMSSPVSVGAAVGGEAPATSHTAWTLLGSRTLRSASACHGIGLGRATVRDR